MRALLDVNVLIALLDADHVQHTRTRDWFRAHAKRGWASCPLTQNGCIRIMSLPAYPNPVPTSAVIERLAAATRHPSHEFWADDCSLLDPGVVHADRVHGPKQVTDVYLLALAVKHQGQFTTFDGKVPVSAVPNATKKHLAAI
jgi:hypothetical protein